jgi:AcrR family transcriptional regulator
MEMQEAPLELVPKRRPGRPLGFDREAALNQAMLLFWRHGYEATSINDLTAAMTITPPSLYTAFGDKKQLFLEAVQRYVSGPVTSESIIDDAPTAREAAVGLLQAAAIGFTGDSTPSGCLLASSAISCSPAAADVQRALSEIRLGIEKQLRSKIEQDNATHRPNVSVDAGTMAAYVMALIQGMSTLARDGAPRRKLLAVANAAMQSWPV